MLKPTGDGYPFGLQSVTAMTARELRLHLEYVHWKSEVRNPITCESAEEFLAYLNEFESTRRKLPQKENRRIFYSEETYTVRKDDVWIGIFYWDNGYKNIRYRYFDSKRSTKNTGSGIAALREEFQKRNGISMCKAFGTTEEEFKRCIPKQIQFSNGKYEGKTSSVDLSSAFPSNMRGCLPDAHKPLVLSGTVKPNAEYPFAFYLNSGHSAEFQRYDTHDWVRSKYAEHLFNFKRMNFEKSGDADCTVLMKASDYELTDIWNDFYDIKKNGQTEEEIERAKLAMNSAIGCMHRKEYKRDKYAHLAVIALCRTNQIMLDVLENELRCAKIIQACVDGIIYKGKAIRDTEKKLGALVQEYEDKMTSYRGTNQYIVMEGDKLIKWKHAGFDTMADGSPIHEPTSLDEQWGRANLDRIKEILQCLNQK